MKFTKMHGTGNDYVYVDLFSEQITNPSELAIQVSHRHFGIGSDGLILIKPHPEADAEMEMYNADGSLSEMCGNGLRCVAKYVYDHGISHKKTLDLATGAGRLQANIVQSKNDLATRISIRMGAPQLLAEKIPVNLSESPVVEVPMQVDDRTFLITCVSMGNPHCIIYVDDVQNFPVEKYGSLIENSELFPNRVNIEFVQILSKDRVIQRTWERGSGETWACGTGASAVCVAGTLTGKTNRHLFIELLGGELELEYPEDGNDVILTGPAEEVFQGEFPTE